MSQFFGTSDRFLHQGTSWALIFKSLQRASTAASVGAILNSTPLVISFASDHLDSLLMCRGRSEPLLKVTLAMTFLPSFEAESLLKLIQQSDRHWDQTVTG